MLSLSIEGLDTLEAHLGALPTEVIRDLSTKATALAEALGEKVRGDKLSGQILNARSGDLRASIVSEVTVNGDGIVASVGSVGDIKYATIQEYGGRTAAHEILANKASALAFMIGGAQHFAKRVEHPGSIIPERSYLRSSLEEMRAEIVATLAESVGEAWELS
jgi:phage gpG-like protein